MISSRMTSKAQTIVPHSVQAALPLCPGDEIATVIEAGRVVMTRAQPEMVIDGPFRALPSGTDWRISKLISSCEVPGLKCGARIARGCWGS